MIPDGFRSPGEDVDINGKGADVLKQRILVTHVVKQYDLCFNVRPGCEHLLKLSTSASCKNLSKKTIWIIHLL